MSVSREDYENIIRQQSDGKLTILIDVSAWRQFLDKADPEKLGSLVNRPLNRSIALIRLLSRIDLLVLFLSIGLSIPAFGLWALVAAPTTLIGGIFYKRRASIGKQRGLVISAIFILALFGSLIYPSLDLWVRAFIVSTATALFLMRLLYVFTNIIVFQLIHSSYEFFSEFYLKPDGAVIPFIWTQPEYSRSGEIA